MAIDITAPGGDAAALRTALADLLFLSAFRASKNANQTGIVSGVNTLIVWEVEDFDIGSNFASGIWTPPAGLVMINAGLAINGANIAAGETGLLIYKNGAAIRRSGSSVPASAANKPNTQLLDLADGDDTYEVYVQLTTSTSTGTVTGTGASATASFFQGICFAQ